MNKKLLREYIKKTLVESKKSDAFEEKVAAVIDSSSNSVNATAMKPVQLPDVRVTIGELSSYVEVKMNHTDNLSNKRIYFDGSVWRPRKNSPSAEATALLANQSSEAAAFLDDLRSFIGRTDIYISSTKSGLKKENAVSPEEMREFLMSRNNQYIVIGNEDVDVGHFATEHYLLSKASPAHYLQAGNDFYMIGAENPLELSPKIPQLEGTGTFKIRVGMRGQDSKTPWFEIQPELKMKNLKPSQFSVFGNEKINPFSEK
jgi:hypothetical protein